MKIRYTFPEGHTYTGDIDPEVYLQPLLAFKALERVRVYDGITFFNDSMIKPCDINYSDGAILSFIDEEDE